MNICSECVNFYKQRPEDREAKCYWGYYKTINPDECTDFTSKEVFESQKKKK